jgi:hypothetical protein
MAVDLAELARKAFQHTGPRNPLNRLSEVDKSLVFSLLTVYAFELQYGGKPDRFVKFCEQAARTAVDALALAKQLQLHVFRGESAKPLRPFIGDFQDLPLQLGAFANRLGSLMNVLGKPGHKARALRNRLLVEASEVVKLRTGGYNDEHLAELFQAIRMDHKNRSDNPDDFSGDAIRKKRENFKKTHPVLYRQTTNSMLKMCGNCAKLGNHMKSGH